MVEVNDVGEQQLQDLKRELGVAPELASCHTALVGEYILEGHVPADLIDKLLMEKPDVAGLAVPGMPPGSPGMGAQGEPYEIFAFDREGQAWVYERR